MMLKEWVRDDALAPREWFGAARLRPAEHLNQS